MLSFQTKALVVSPVGGNSFGMTPPDCMVGLANMFRQSCLFCFCFSYKERLLFGSPLNAYQNQTELTLGLSDIYIYIYLSISVRKVWNKQSQSVAPSVHGSVLD